MPQIMQASKKDEEKQENKLDTLNKLMSIGMSVADFSSKLSAGGNEGAKDFEPAVKAISEGKDLGTIAKSGLMGPLERRYNQAKAMIRSF